MKLGFAKYLFGAAMVTSIATSPMQAQEDRNVLIIYDSSNSMWGELTDGSRKYEAGRTALASIVEQGFGGRQIGFRAYGHREKDDCRDSQLITSFTDEAIAGQSIVEAANAIRPTGKTPITYSLTEGLKDFADSAGDILLVSDGLETCDADPCALMAEWQDRDVNVRVHVVGVGLNDVERLAMSCIADTSGGTYFDVDSADGFLTALQDASNAIETVETAVSPDAGDEDTGPDGSGFAIVYRAFDASGRQYVDAKGRLFQGGTLLDEQLVAQGRGRNIVEGPGSYDIEVGVLLKDGTVYEPRRYRVDVTKPGDTLVDVTVAAPARVNAVFTERGVPHPGALVSAYQEGNEVFRFRPQDSAYARPGEYEFRAKINDDNQVAVNATLSADQQTTVAFELVQTVRVYIEFELSDGTTLLRNSTLWRDEEEVYRLHGGNGGEVKPGTYQVMSDDQNLPLPPTELVIGTGDETTYRLALPAGWITVRYPDKPENFFNGRVSRRAQLHSLERGNWTHSAPNTAIAVAPGKYEVRGFPKDGSFAPVRVMVAQNDRIEVTLTPDALGELVVTYAPSENYAAKPDRAFAEALDGQLLVNSFLRPGKPVNLLPGLYEVSGRSNSGDIPVQKVMVRAGERAEVILRLAGE